MHSVMLYDADDNTNAVSRDSFMAQEKVSNNE